MNKLIKTGNIVIVQLEDGKSFNKTGITHEEFLQLSENLDNNEFIYEFFVPEYKESLEKRKEYEEIISEITNVPFLSYNAGENSVYWLDVSPLSMPEDFLTDVLDAYKKGDEKVLHAFKNFWTLLSLNPTEKCRKKLWWFLKNHDLKISSSGFFITYRNVDETGEKDDEGNPVYTDRRTHTTKVSIGHRVSMPREECDLDVDRECSRGLHTAGSNWLEQKYYGNVGLVCLINPAEVVSVPGNSSYGKIRSFAYIPIDYAKFDDEGSVIPYDVEQGFECKYAAQAIYEGIVSIESDKYTIKVPELPGIDSVSISDNLLKLAKECLTHKDYNVV